jgi:hypothetical protein
LFLAGLGHAVRIGGPHRSVRLRAGRLRRAGLNASDVAAEDFSHYARLYGFTFEPVKAGRQISFDYVARRESMEELGSASVRAA